MRNPGSNLVSTEIQNAVGKYRMKASVQRSVQLAKMLLIVVGAMAAVPRTSAPG
jgi:hypothetical protein